MFVYSNCNNPEHIHKDQREVEHNINKSKKYPLKHVLE